MQPPLYPIFIAGIYKLGGTDPKLAYIVQAILGTIAVVLLMLFARISVGPRAFLPTGILAAVYPSFLWLPRRLLSENLAIPIVLIVLCVAVWTVKTRNAASAVFLGISLGMGILTRAAFSFLALTVGATLLFVWLRANTSIRQTLSLVTVVVATCLATLSPWLTRNWAQFGSPTISTLSGLTLYSSYWPPVVGGRRIWSNIATRDDPTVRWIEEGGNEVAVSQRAAQATVQRLFHDPWRPIVLAPDKLLNLFVPLDWEILPPPPSGRASLNFGYLLIMPLALLGGAISIRRPEAAFGLIVWAPLIAAVLQALVFHGTPRYRLLAEPSLVVLAIVAILSARGGPMWLHRSDNPER